MCACSVTTHNNDCQECDIRLTLVPARDWPANARRPVYDIREAYPRYVEALGPSDGGSWMWDNIHGPDYLLEKVDRSIHNWNVSIPMGFIDQVPHTYAYVLGGYGVQNEKQVSDNRTITTNTLIVLLQPREEQSMGRH